MTSPPDHNAELVRDYLAWCRDIRGLTVGSLYVYASCLAALLEHLRTTDLEKATLSQLEAFVLRKRTGRAKNDLGAPATRRRDVGVITGMYKYLHGRGLISANPALLLVGPKVANQNPRPIPDDLWLSVWTAELNEIERVVLGLGFYCGFRRIEMTTIAPHMVVWPTKAFVSFKRKGGGDDILPFGDVMDVWESRLPHLLPGGPERFYAPLRALQQKRLGQPTLLPDVNSYAMLSRRTHERPRGEQDPNDINRMFLRMFRRLGMPTDTFTPHALRHSFVTDLLRASVPLHLVSRLANHSDTATTMRYTRAGGQELKEWSKSFSTREINRF